MHSTRANRKSFRFAVCTALAAGLVAGAAVADPFSGNGSEAVAKAEYSDNKVLAKAEKAVVRDPQNIALRAELASAYLGAGRFDSAITTYEDAIALGDASPRTALSLALAYAGTGRNADAKALLDQWRDSIPASDFGLAVALAGDTGRGVSILSDQLRGDNANAKLRQNLAYAYALDGRWREARVMAAQDLPANLLDARISEWAMQGRPEDYQKRVAGMIGAPVIADAGQPAFLALNGAAPEARPAMAVADLPAPAPVRDSELPPVDSGESFWGFETREPASLLAPVEKYAAAPPSPQPAARSMPAETPAAKAFGEAFAASDTGPDFISRPVVQAIPERKVEKSRLAIARLPSTDSTHLVQLGSFSSRENAERAWKIYQRRYPSLAGRDLQITEAVVRGKRYWRVAAAGFDRSSARSMCSSVKGRGHGCIAYHQGSPLPGAVQQAGSGQMLARRR